jgi:hypothetical protein
MSRDTELLFSKYDVHRVLENQTRTMRAAIDGIDGKTLLSRPVDAWVDEFAAKYCIVPIILDETGITVDQEEAQVDVSNDFARAIFDRSRPFYIKGVTVSFFVPFSGEEDLFLCQPSSYMMNLPRGRVDGKTLVVTFTRTDHDAAAVKAEFERQLGSIKGYIETIARDLAPFNAGLRGVAREHLERRMEKIRKDQALVTDLGYPKRQA